MVRAKCAEAPVIASLQPRKRRAGPLDLGTIHTVQGREAEAVILVLGAPEAGRSGARGWAGGRPNLLNVAVTRAREVIYVVGNRALWRRAGVFQTLDARLPAAVAI